MRIELCNFRSYAKKTIEFPIFKVSLLEGTSGQGKTTIFEAIKFALYNEPSNVYPLDGTKSCKVKLVFSEYENLTIVRSKPPQILKVKHLGRSYDDISAQDYINCIFGGLSSYNCTTYASQNEYHPLLKLNNREKFDLLTVLAFGEEKNNHHPEVIINNVNNKIKELERKSLKQAVVIKTLKHELIEEYQSVSSKELVALNNNLESENSKLVELTKLHSAALNARCKYNQDVLLLKNLTDRLGSLTDDDLDDLEDQLELLELKSQLELLDFTEEVDDSQLPDLSLEVLIKYLPWLESYEQAKSKILEFDYSLEDLDSFSKYKLVKSKINIVDPVENLDDLIPHLEIYDKLYVLINKLPRNYWTLDNPENYYEYIRVMKQKPKNFIQNNFTVEELEREIKICDVIIKEKSILKPYKLEYSKEFITSKIENLSKKLAKQPSLIRRKVLVENIEKLELLIEKTSKDLIRLQKYRDTYKFTTWHEAQNLGGVKCECPECEAVLTFDQNILKKLYIAETIPELTQVKIKKLIEQEEKLRTEIAKLEIMQSELNTLPEGEPCTTDLSVVIAKLSQLIFPENHIIDPESYLSSSKWLKLLNSCDIPPEFVINETNNVRYLQETEKLRDLLLCEKSKSIVLDSVIFDTPRIHQWIEYKKYLSQIEELGKFMKPPKNLNIELEISKTRKIIKDNQVNTLKLESLKKESGVVMISYNTFQVNKWIASLTNKKYQDLKSEIQKYKDLGYSIKKTKILIQEAKIKPVIQEQINALKIIPVEDDPENINELISSCKLEIKNIEGKIAHFTKCHYIKIKNKKHYTILEEIKDLEQLSDLAISARRITLEKFVFNFNKIMNDILEELFSSEIRVNIKLEKQNKSNDKVRQQINFDILYQGHSFDTINILSGGEKDRVSLAILISLSCIHGNKILFLDECLASLNEELRNTCIKTLKRFTPKKTIINVCHSVTHGYHDHVIDLN